MNNISEAMPEISIGAAVRLQHSHTTFYVAEVMEEEGDFHILGGRGGMAKITKRYKAVTDDLNLVHNANEHSVQTVYPQDKWKTPEQVQQLVKDAEEKQDQNVRKAAQERKEREARNEVFYQDAEKRLPANAKAVIVAELVQNESDIMTDYFGSTTTRTVILAFSTHTRDLFPEMRKAALNFSETEHLYSAEPSAEHREKYSMGGGYYLKEGYRHHCGWQVSKVPLTYSKDVAPCARRIPVGEWSLGAPSPTKAPNTRTAAQSTKAHVEEHTHTKKGFQMFIVVMADTVDKDKFRELRDKASAMSGWYSRKWGKTPGGFAFAEQENADSFISMYLDPEYGQEEIVATTSAVPKLAGKLRGLAEAMTSQIENKLSDRLTNTPKRLAQARNAELEGRQLQRTQVVLNKLADLHEQEKVPPLLVEINTKSAVFSRMESKKENISNGYHGYRIETGEPYSEDETTLALWELLQDEIPAVDSKERVVQKLMDDVRFVNIAGYFPTPKKVVDTMIEYAELEAGHKVLEPNGGSGAIIEEVFKVTGRKVTAYEVNYSLVEILEAQGNSTVMHTDFLSVPEAPEFDRILMNPPFENLQDVDHVQHAYKFLNEGGRMVAIMSPSPFFRQDKKSTDFREWFESVGGEKIDLPEGSFKESGTNVNTVMVVISKD